MNLLGGNYFIISLKKFYKEITLCFNNFFNIKQYQMEISDRAIDRQTDLMIKDIAELYVRLEQRTQYLTNIQRYLPNRRRIKFFPSKHICTTQSLLNLIVQLSYFLYTCHRMKVIVYLSNDLIVRLKDQEWELYQEYLLERQFMDLSESNQSMIGSRFHKVDTSKYQSAYSEYLDRKLGQYLGLALQHKNMKEKRLKEELQGLKKVLDLGHSLYKQSGEKPQVFIRYLEETELFQAHSILLKTQNCSLYYSLCKKEKKYQRQLKQIRDQQKNLYSNAKKMRQAKQSKQVNLLIEETIDKFIADLLLNRVVEIEVSFNSNSSSNKDSSGKSSNPLGIMSGKVNDRKKKWKIKVQQKKFQELTEENFLKIRRGQRICPGFIEQNSKKYNSFEIEYSSKKDLISVKYLSDVVISLENMDSLMCHCNNLMFEWTNASMQEVQKSIIQGKGGQTSKKVEKVVGFKVVSNFSTRNDPLRNILVMIDMAMIYGKMAEPELERKQVRMEDYNEFAIVTKKIDHLNKLFINKIKAIYDLQFGIQE